MTRDAQIVRVSQNLKELTDTGNKLHIHLVNPHPVNNLQEKGFTILIEINENKDATTSEASLTIPFTETVLTFP